MELRPIDSPLWDDYVNVVSAHARTNVPVNLMARIVEQVDTTVDYAVRSGTGWKEQLDRYGIPLTNKVIVELGPGLDFGVGLIIGEECHKLIIADRFIAPWQADFHQPVYEGIRKRLGRPSRLLDAVIARQGYEGVITTVSEPAHAMPSILSGAADLVHSNAVLEHVHPLDVAAREMYRITAPGGYSVHQVDFRYHRDPNYPLEHLLFTEDEFLRIHEATYGEAGCQTRISEAIDCFIRAGFELVRSEANQMATDEYMQDFLPRLRQQTTSRYRDWPEVDLRKICGQVIFRRPR